MKRSFLFLLILSLMLTATPGFGQTISHENEARTLYDLKLFNGISSTEFVPDLANMSNREQAMTIIAVALQWQLDMSAKSPFDDVSDWAQPYVAKAYQMGVTSGISATEFGGKRNVTQRELAAWMLRALGYDGNETWNNTVQLSAHIGSTLDPATMNTQINRDKLVGMLYNFLKEGKVISESKTLIQKYLDVHPNFAGIAQKAGMTAAIGEVMEFVLIESRTQTWDARSMIMKSNYSYDTGLIDSTGKFMLLYTAGTSGMVSQPAMESTTYFIKDLSIKVPFSNGRAIGTRETISVVRS
ncbi:MAG: S-layer homology domain-containing protein [Clostridiales bacterium]|nr:S-layer homology domain-containing protein [Clostridiales bacterium]